MPKGTDVLTIPLQGGLGNQLFELAAGLALAARTGRPVRFSDYWLRHPEPGETPRAFALDGLLREEELVHDRAERVGGLTDRIVRRRVVERSSDDDALARVSSRTRVVAGYFHRLAYVRDSWAELRSRLESSTRIEHRALVTPSPHEDGALHYRLGDYLSNPAARAAHGATAPDFFVEAVRADSRRLGIARWFVVSDDPVTAVRLLTEAGVPDGVELVPTSGADEWDDLRVLASAREAVLSNSSFSWWGGFIGHESHGMRVVAPSPWFTDDRAAEPDFFPVAWERRERAVLTTDS